MGDYSHSSQASNKNTSTTFGGLTKEELSKSYNEKKWIAIRLTCSICFGIVWLAVLVNVILIIAEVAKCLPEPKPKWYQDNVVYKVHIDEFAGNLHGLRHHLRYVDDMRAQTLLVSGVNDENDPSAIVDGQENAFDPLLKEIHKKRGRKLIVDVVVDSLPVENEKFLRSSYPECVENSNAGSCDMFIWKTLDAQSNDSNEEWIFDELRNQSFKSVKGTPNLAVLNYSNNETLPYILHIINSWLARGVDGISVRDVSRLHNISAKEFTTAVWKNQFFSEESRALYITSSTPEVNSLPGGISNNENSFIHSPLLLTTNLSRFVGEAGAGLMIENFINKWRSESHIINGYEVTSFEEPLAASRLPSYAAGLMLLLLALPGVPVVRSGDEMLATSSVFSWNPKPRDIEPTHENDRFLKEMKQMISLRVAGVRLKESLRFDTKDNHTSLTFLKINNPDIVVFKRQWSNRDPVMIVSNMSPNDHTVSIMVPGSFTRDNDLLAEAKILASSHPATFVRDDVISLDSIQLKSGLTLVMKEN